MKSERLSVTTWPGSPVPVPHLPRYPEATLDGETIWIPNWGTYWEMAPTPPELYLRHAHQTDLLDPQALLNFVRSVGGVPYVLEDRDLFPETKEARARFAAARNRRYAEPQLIAGRGWGVHLDEIAYRLRILDILGRHAIAYKAGNYLAPVWKDAYTKSKSARSRIKTEEDAWREFSYHANQALQVFHVRVLALTADGHEIGDHGATFLEAAVLQLVNDLADEVDYLTCPNCGLIFGRQVGGSMHYSRRTGVTYCSPSCATAARVKEYRARKRAERKA